MLHRTRRDEQSCVRLVGGEKAPVGAVPERTEEVEAQTPGRVGWAEPRREQGNGSERDDRGRQQTPEAALPEPQDADATRARALAQEDRGEQEAGECEEQADPEVAAGCMRHAPVEREHRGDREGTDAVERGDVRAAAERPRRLNLPP